MSSPYIRPVAIITFSATIAAVALSALWRVPYIFTFLGVATIVLAGHIVTIDDDLPGGWSNPDGAQGFLWSELVIKASVVVVLGLLALSPSVRALGQ
jgi:hypothetical protein